MATVFLLFAAASAILTLWIIGVLALNKDFDRQFDDKE
jgi:hypothetical protein